MASLEIHDLARGRWRTILPALGVHERFLTGHNCPCPLCGGTDRFRWTNLKGGGGYFCSKCEPGTGFDLVMKVNGIDFKEAVKRVRELIATAPVESPRAMRSSDSTRRAIDEIWKEAKPLNGICAASKYLNNRGIRLPKYPNQIRFLKRARVKSEGEQTTYHPALVSKFVSPDTKDVTLHFTYLDDAGNKADIEKVKRFIAGGKVPKGGAVRLAPSADTMGIAEGLETSFSASMLFDIPVWAALTAGALMQWEPPERARNIIIFGDPDQNYAGHAASYTLAHRLVTVAKRNVEVRLPSDIDADWNEVLLSGLPVRGREELSLEF